MKAATTLPNPAAAGAKVLRRTVRSDSGCWLWNGTVNQRNYGIVRVDGTALVAHRAMVIARDGSIPEGMTVDHLCHDSYDCTEQPCPHRRCVNPAHLAVVSQRENIRRKWDRDICHNGGHPLSILPNGYRRCMTCWHARLAAKRGPEVIAS